MEDQAEDLQVNVEEIPQINEDQAENIGIVLSPELMEFLVNIDALLVENNNELKILNEKLTVQNESFETSVSDDLNIFNDIHTNTSYIIAFLFFFALCIVFKNIYSIFSQML